MISQDDMIQLFIKVEKHINTTAKIQIYGSTNWSAMLPKLPGIYVIWNRDNKVVYVGETSNLQARMNDLRDTRHHTLRRSVGHAEFSNEVNFQMATSKKKFSENIEDMVTEYFKANLSLTFCTTKIGRKEFEEFLVNKYKPMYNSSLGRRHANILDNSTQSL